MALEKRETRVEARVYFYEGQGFGTVRELIRTQVFDGDKPVGGPTDELRKVDDPNAIAAIFGEEIAKRRGDLDTLRAQHDGEMANARDAFDEDRARSTSEIETLNGRIADLEERWAAVLDIISRADAARNLDIAKLIKPLAAKSEAA